MSGHRKTTHRVRALLIAAMIVTGIALTIAIASVDTAYTPAPTSAAPTATATATVKVTPKVDPVRRAENIKPLMRLAPGDRVLLWRPDSQVPRHCIWENWSGDVDFSNVRCDDDNLQINVHTAYLSPVENR